MPEDQDAFSDLLPIKVPLHSNNMQNPETPFADDAVLANMPIREDSHSSGQKHSSVVAPISGSPMVRPYFDVQPVAIFKKWWGGWWGIHLYLNIFF